jgi:parallel beta-helix repeat protein
MSQHKSGKRIGLVLSAALLAGTAAQADIIDTIQAAKSGQTVNVSGTYSVSRPCNVPDGVTVTGPATFNFNGAGNGFVPGNNVRLNSLTVTGVHHPGIYIYGKSGCVINSCIATGNSDTGIQIQAAGAVNNTIQYCQSKLNVDTATQGQNADGFTCKFGAGSGNKFVNCDAHQNSDDGYDFWQAGAPVTVSGCQAYNNGSLAQGNGNGFKMGASGDNNAHVYTSCTAHNNSGTTGCGFTQNGNVGNVHLTGCHSYSNKNKDVLNNCTLTNCTMQQ